MAEETGKLHVAMLPWLAMGHILPFFELSKRLALKGVQITFFSTPSNILRLPSIPQTLTPFFNFVPCPPPAINGISSNVENTVDLRSEAARPLLKRTYDDFEKHLISFLHDPTRPKPNWIIHDILAGTWAPAVASLFGINSALFGVFNAAAFSILKLTIDYDSPEKLTKVPDFIPFPTNVTFRPFEARRIIPFWPPKAEETESRPRGNRLLLIRTFREFEAKWIDLLGESCVPVGFLPQSCGNEEDSEAGARISEWLDKQKERSVIYASFGSEAILTREQIDEIGLGLETTGLPFVWILRVGSPPQGFEERTAGRGMVWMGWVPQTRLLAHSAIGGFLMQGGWNSVAEGMALGLPIVVLPMVFEQGLTARHLVETGYAVEVVRNDEDGYFSGEEVARKLKMVMVEEEGEELRKKARAGKEIFGCEKLQDKYIDELVENLWEKRMMVSQPA